MARIIFALPRFHTNLWFAVRAMLAAGHDVRLLVNLSGNGEDHTHLAPQVMGRYPPQDEVNAAFDDFQPDILFTRNAWALSRRAARAARQRGIPALLYNLHPMTQKTSLFRRAELLWKGLPQERVTPVAGWPKDRPHDPLATYLPWPIEALPAPEPLPKPADKLHLVCVGKLGLPRKNQPQLIDAMAKAGLDKAYHVTLVGSAPRFDKPGQKDHAARVQDIASLDWVTMLSDVPFQKMANVYASADVCCLPSFGEPLGISPLEAMAYGAIPVISDDAGAAGYVDQGKNGFVVDMNQPGTAADALRQIAEDTDRRGPLSRHARQTAETELSAARFMERLDAIIAQSKRR